MKHLSKRIRLWSFLLLGSGMFTLSSCGNGELTKGKAEDALEDALVMFKDSSQFELLPVGYLEIDGQTSRKQFKQLAKLGMITYKEEAVIEHKKYSNYNWYSGRTYTTKDVLHYFATIALTPEGSKYVISDPVTEIEDEDMENKSKKKEIEIDAITDIRIADSIASVEAARAKARAKADDDEKEKSEYEEARDNVNYTKVPLLSHKNRIAKVKNIYCPEEWLKQGKAACVYIYENVKVTPFGRILGYKSEGERHMKGATFIYYLDEGWQVEK